MNQIMKCDGQYALNDPADPTAWLKNKTATSWNPNYAENQMKVHKATTTK